MVLPAPAEAFPGAEFQNLVRNTPTFPREVIRLFAGGRRMEVRLVVGARYELGKGEAIYPGVRVMNSLDGSWAVRAEDTLLPDVNIPATWSASETKGARSTRQSMWSGGS